MSIFTRSKRLLSKPAMEVAAKYLKGKDPHIVSMSAVLAGLRHDNPMPITFDHRHGQFGFTRVESPVLWVFGATGAGKAEVVQRIAREGATQGYRTISLWGSGCEVDPRWTDDECIVLTLEADGPRLDQLIAFEGFHDPGALHWHVNLPSSFVRGQARDAAQSHLRLIVDELMNERPEGLILTSHNIIWPSDQLEAVQGWLRSGNSCHGVFCFEDIAYAATNHDIENIGRTDEALVMTLVDSSFAIDKLGECLAGVGIDEIRNLEPGEAFHIKGKPYPVFSPLKGDRDPAPAFSGHPAGQAIATLSLLMSSMDLSSFDDRMAAVTRACGSRI